MSVFAGITAILCLAILAGSAYFLARRPEALERAPAVHLGFVTLSAVAFYKLLALFTFAVLPVAATAAGQIELLEGAKTVDSCGACHVMTPMITDMRDPASDSLAARHFKNRFISEDQCYHCHSGYGFNGALAAKLEGYRHLVRYTTGLYEEPIASRVTFDNASCLACHEGTPRFDRINSHILALDKLGTSESSCTNCHGPAHPTRTERTPGSAAYAFLMNGAAP